MSSCHFLKTQVPESAPKKETLETFLDFDAVKFWHLTDFSVSACHNPHLLERPDSHDVSVDLTEFRKVVFGILLKRARSHLARLWSAELAGCSDSSQTVLSQ